MEVQDFKTDFMDSNEEMQYWKDQANHYRRVVQETQDDMAEFTEFSKDLERELESQLKENEKELKELRQKNMKLNLENESLKEKLEKQQEDGYRQLTELEDELATANALRAENTKYIRELEQMNDDLERTKRATIVSLEDFEHRMNQAMEKNAFLESELDEKEALAVTVQRLRDEARDLGQELAVRKKKEDINENDEHILKEDLKTQQSTPIKPTSLPVLTRQPSSPMSPSPVIIRANNVSQQSTPTREQNGLLSNGQFPKGTSLTPSARVSALNIVGELLRKVGALESKLSSCRNFVREQPKGVKATQSVGLG